MPDGRLARFYELKKNKPLYFVRDTYELTYSDGDMPTHYAFKVSGEQRIASIEAYLDRVRNKNRQVLREESLERWRGEVDETDVTEVAEIVALLDDRGRWVEEGSMRPAERGQPRIPARVISCRTFNRNLRKLARYIALANEADRR